MNGFATQEELKIEAVKRMELINLKQEIIDDFRRDKLSVIENLQTFDGIYFSINHVPSKIQQEIERLENESGFKIFCVIKSESDCGVMYNCMLVSKYKDDWKQEVGLLKSNIMVAYCVNETYPDCSELGTIVTENHNGFLLRIG